MRHTFTYSPIKSAPKDRYIIVFTNCDIRMACWNEDHEAWVDLQTYLVKSPPLYWTELKNLIPKEKS